MGTTTPFSAFWSRCKWITREAVAVIGLLGVASVVLKAFDLVGYKIRSPYNWLILGVLFLLFLGNYIIERGHTSFLRSLGRAVSFIPWNLILLLFGQDFQRRRLKELQLVTNAVQQSALFARVVGLRSGVTAKYYIVFSHNDKEGGGADHSIGKGERYRIPGFPVDEAECIIRLWYMAASTLNLRWADIQVLCSCTWNNEIQRNAVLDSSLAIVGSPKKNAYAGKLIERINQLEKAGDLKREAIYDMVVENGLCLLRGYKPQHASLRPDSTDGGPTGILTDYALLMRLPNILNDSYPDQGTILLLAGCKVAGQVALTDWFSEAANLGSLASEFGPDSFQVIFQIKYEYVESGVPKIIENKELYRERINVHIQKVRKASAGQAQD